MYERQHSQLTQIKTLLQHTGDEEHHNDYIEPDQLDLSHLEQEFDLTERQLKYTTRTCGDRLVDCFSATLFVFILVFGLYAFQHFEQMHLCLDVSCELALQETLVPGENMTFKDEYYDQICQINQCLELNDCQPILIKFYDETQLKTYRKAEKQFLKSLKAEKRKALYLRHKEHQENFENYYGNHKKRFEIDDICYDNCKDIIQKTDFKDYTECRITCKNVAYISNRQEGYKMLYELGYVLFDCFIFALVVYYGLLTWFDDEDEQEIEIV